MVQKYIHFHRAWFDSREEKELIAALRSGWSTTGPRTEKFERAMAKYLGVKYAVGVNSCTAALHLALLAGGVGEGDEVITSPFTFASTVNVIEHCRAKPVFVDVKPDTLNMDEAAIEAALSRRTRAILPVHFAGRPCEMRRICSLARRKGLLVIGDCAHALETEYGGKKVGAWGDAAAFSFYATKNITTGEGGMLATNDAGLAEQARVMRLHGLSRDAWKRFDRGGVPHYEVHFPGFKYNMFDLQAALGLVQLKKVERFWRLRRKLKQAYDGYFAGVAGLTVLKDVPRATNAHHLYVLVLDAKKLGVSRDEVLKRMERKGIGVGVHFRPVHLQPYYRRKYGFKKGILPRAEYAGQGVISLPLYPSMKAADVKRAAQALLSIIKA